MRHALRILRWLGRLLALAVLAGLMAYSSVRLQDPTERVRRYTRAYEFDFFDWTLGAAGAKLEQGSLGSTDYLGAAGEKQLVLKYFDLMGEAERLQAEVQSIYADPSLADPAVSAAPTVAQLTRVRDSLHQLQAPAEAVLQEQASNVLADLGLGVGGKIFPPLSFEFSRLPDALIVSPRTAIRQDANIQLTPGLSLEQQMALESAVEKNLNVSALVVPVGGIGTYPTMVEETTALDWVLETVIHEWTHNYLSLRPLGMNYDTTPELRTMNETTASLIGKEVGRLVLQRYYPERVPPPAPAAPSPPPPGEPPAFDFRAEMHTTRVHVDQLLAEGKVDEAEAYMEARRKIFYDHGYHFLRKLNQAYFAFYGAYADEPGGAAGEDPVGAAVRELRTLSGSPLAFLRRIAGMSSYADLTRALAPTP